MEIFIYLIQSTLLFNSLVIDSLFLLFLEMFAKKWFERIFDFESFNFFSAILAQKSLKLEL